MITGSPVQLSHKQERAAQQAFLEGEGHPAGPHDDATLNEYRQRQLAIPIAGARKKSQARKQPQTRKRQLV